MDLLVGRMDLTVLRRGHAMSFNRKHIQLDGTQTFINLGALRAIFVLLPFSETALQQKACAVLLRSFACSDRKGIIAISSTGRYKTSAVHLCFGFLQVLQDFVLLLSFSAENQRSFQLDSRWPIWLFDLLAKSLLDVRRCTQELCTLMPDGIEPQLTSSPAPSSVASASNSPFNTPSYRSGSTYTPKAADGSTATASLGMSVDTTCVCQQALSQRTEPLLC